MAAKEPIAAGKAHFKRGVHDLDAEDAGLLAEPGDYLAQARQVALQHRVFKRELKQLVHLLGSGGAILLELEAKKFSATKTARKINELRNIPAPSPRRSLLESRRGMPVSFICVPFRLPSRICYYDTFQAAGTPLASLARRLGRWPHLVRAGEDGFGAFDRCGRGKPGQVRRRLKAVWRSFR